MQEPFRNRRRPGQGQAMAEYALVGGLVLVACIGIIVLLGQNVQGLLAGIIPGSSSRATAVRTTAGLPMGAGFAGQAPSGGALVPMGTLRLKLGDGTTVNLNSPANINKSIQTVGANGTTNLLASSLESLAGQLKDKGKIDQQTDDLIMQLANSAHQLAGVESAVETTMAKAGNDPQAALNMPVVFEGKTYATVTDLATTLGTMSGTANGRGAQITGFYDIWTALHQPGAIQDPSVTEIVDAYAQEISGLSFGSQEVLRQMSTGQGTPDIYRTQLVQFLSGDGYDETAKKLNADAGSAVTNVDGVNVCGTGGHTDAGTHCAQ